MRNSERNGNYGKKPSRNVGNENLDKSNKNHSIHRRQDQAEERIS
jgi:hypothetical protein